MSHKEASDKLALVILENGQLKEHARKSLMKFRVALGALKNVQSFTRKSSRANKIARKAIRLLEGLE